MGYAASTITWRTRDNGVILIKDMTTSHLENTIAMFVRGVDRLRETMLLSAYSFRGQCRGDMACDAMDSAIDEIENMEDEELLAQENPQFAALYKEWKKR